MYIGKNCVVGAGSFVTRSIPDNCVVAEIHARVICTTEEYAQKMKNSMPADWELIVYKSNKKIYLIK